MYEHHHKEDRLTEVTEVRMDIKTLQTISLQILQAREQHDVERYRPILRMLSEPPLSEFSIPDREELPARRIFIYLLRFFHPDRFIYLSGRIETARRSGDEEYLKAFRTLFELMSVPRRARPVVSYTQREEYSYDQRDFDDSHGYQDAQWVDQWIEEEFCEHDAFSAICAVTAGNSGIVIDRSDLEHLSGELDLSGMGIVDLDGCEYLSSVTNLRLNSNEISNLYDLKGLYALQELDLSDNDIDDIQYLSGLENLIELDISGNPISDLSPLLALEKLEYLDISRTPAVRSAKAVLEELSARQVVIITFAI